MPIYNEEATVTELCGQIKEVMEKIYPRQYEIIFVNDGSTDASLCRLVKILPQIKELVILNLEKNFGQSSALQAGIDFSSGEIIITLDGDLQNDPKDIQKLLDKINQGYDVVCGWRKDKYSSWFKMLASRFANLIRRVFFNEQIHDVGCTFRAYKKKALSGINLDGCKHRFLTALLARKEINLGEVKTRAYPRAFGASKYGVIDRLSKSIPEIFNVYFSKNTSLSSQRMYKINKIIRHQTNEPSV